MTLQQQTLRMTNRPIQDNADFWRVRAFLAATYPATPPGFHWEIRRWDGSRFHHAADDWATRFAGRAQLWETAQGQFIGAVHPEGDENGEAHLQVHPDFRTIEAAMITWAEAHLAAPTLAGGQQLDIFVYDYDTARQALLQTLGYTQLDAGGVVRRLSLPGYRPAVPALAAGYTLRTTEATTLDNCQRVADLLNAAFNRDFHTALEFQNFVRQAPCYRPDLDLVAVAPDGSFAAYVGIAYDVTTRHAVFEPVCTHPDHRQRGLAQTLMCEGLARLHAIGARDVSVETGDMIPANRLYESIGFTETWRGHQWRRLF
ncbi:MAG: GNAT family N-acetyltransferase [Caldilineaceae bacterium]|nr:GNAT family N-acetyltransferase [Caldilineaceae bacterium]